MTLIRTRHTISGQIARVDERMLTHPTFGKYLERVDEDAKPFVPGLFAPGTVAERDEAKAKPTPTKPAKDEN